MNPRAVPALGAFALISIACVTRSSDRAPISEEPARKLAPSTELRVAAPARADDRPVIVSLKTRDSTLRITSTSSGPRFLVERADGVIERELDDAALEQRHPELWDAYRSGYARGEPYLDATGKRDKPSVDARLDP